MDYSLLIVAHHRSHLPVKMDAKAEQQYYESVKAWLAVEASYHAVVNAVRCGVHKGVVTIAALRCATRAFNAELIRQHNMSI